VHRLNQPTGPRLIVTDTKSTYWSTAHCHRQTLHCVSNKTLSCRREAARCFVFVCTQKLHCRYVEADYRVCSQLQHTYSAVFYYQLLRLQIYCIKFYYGLATRRWTIFEDIFMRFDATHERGRQTDRHCMTA